MGTLRVAKSNAITYREKYTVVFNIKDKEYWIEDSKGRMFERKRRLSRSVNFENRSEDGEELDPITFKDDKVVFYSTGAVEGSSGEITIVGRSGNSKTISIIASTGKITIK